MSKKIKILTLSDHPFSPSGVGTQTKYIIEGMLATGKYQFLSLGGAIKHQDYRPQKTEQWGDDWVIFPVDGYGSQEMIRSIIRTERPDVLWFMTDPRFWGWLWQIENEIRPNVPMVYYHVWDNYPYPTFNRKFYLSNDFIATISKVSDDIVANVAPEVDRMYVPHAVDTNIFKKLPQEAIDFYNAADATINISDAEGFGLATLESLACETPIIVTKTGGLQDQVKDENNIFGVEIIPSSRAVIGSQDVPFIYEDRISNEQFIGALETFSNIPKEQRQIIGQLGRQHVIDNFNFTDFIKRWDDIFTNINTNKGSWPNKSYKAWELKEI